MAAAHPKQGNRTKAAAAWYIFYAPQQDKSLELTSKKTSAPSCLSSGDLMWHWRTIISLTWTKLDSSNKERSTTFYLLILFALSKLRLANLYRIIIMNWLYTKIKSLFWGSSHWTLGMWDTTLEHYLLQMFRIGSKICFTGDNAMLGI